MMCGWMCASGWLTVCIVVDALLHVHLCGKPAPPPFGGTVGGPNPRQKPWALSEPTGGPCQPPVARGRPYSHPSRQAFAGDEHEAGNFYGLANNFQRFYPRSNVFVLSCLVAGNWPRLCPAPFPRASRAFFRRILRTRLASTAHTQQWFGGSTTRPPRWSPAMIR